jgi:hypothetical protein
VSGYGCVPLLSSSFGDLARPYTYTWGNGRFASCSGTALYCIALHLPETTRAVPHIPYKVLGLVHEPLSLTISSLNGQALWPDGGATVMTPASI